MSTANNIDFKPRPIPEFRFWHIGRQKMYLVNYFDREDNVMWWPGEDADEENWDIACSDRLNLADGVLMQFTGLFDREGAKIWEGDILYTTFPSDIVKGETLHSYGSVSFMFGGFGIIGGPELIGEIDSFLSSPESQSATNSEKVIGNIYQHRDLLSRDYWYNHETNPHGFAPDNLNFDTESIYTFEKTLSQIIEQIGVDFVSGNDTSFSLEELHIATKTPF